MLRGAECLSGTRGFADRRTGLPSYTAPGASHGSGPALWPVRRIGRGWRAAERVGRPSGCGVQSLAALRPALRLLPEPHPEGRSRIANAGLLLWAIALLVIALLTGIFGAYSKGYQEGTKAALGFPRGFVAALLVDSLLRRADSLNRMATALERELQAFRGLRSRGGRANPHNVGSPMPQRPSPP